MSRRALDSYYTPAWQTRALLAHQPILGTVLEPCAGDGSIAAVLRAHDLSVTTNDIRPGLAEHAYDARTAMRAASVDWIVTNPPYQMPLCRDIVAEALRCARVGVAMLLQISFREPTAKVNPRGPWLEDNPLSRVLTLPRHSYTGNGKSDSATTEWCLWLREPTDLPPILSLYRADVGARKDT